MTEPKQQTWHLRLIAVALWLVAIGLECFALVVLLNQRARTELASHLGFSAGVAQGAGGQPVVEFPAWALGAIIAILLINLVFALCGALVWNAANRLRPDAGEHRGRDLFVQLLGATLLILASLPLVVMVIASKALHPIQKLLATVVALAALVIVALYGVDQTPPTIAQFNTEQHWDRTRVVEITGADEVFWLANGNVYHLCAEVSELRDAEASKLSSGTVAQATSASGGGMERLTRHVQQDIEECNAAGHSFTLPDVSYLEHTPTATFLDELNKPAESEDDAEG
jgi:hypothetical protein